MTEHIYCLWHSELQLDERTGIPTNGMEEIEYSGYLDPLKRFALQQFIANRIFIISVYFCFKLITCKITFKSQFVLFFR